MIRQQAVAAYFRSRRVRRLALIARWPWVRRNAPDLAHIPFQEDPAWGPVPRDEALVLHALVRTIRPATVVEIGFLRGHSALNILTALDADARLYSFDIDPASEHRARVRFGREPRFNFALRSQETLTPEDVDGRPVDLVFLDASHDYDLNCATLDRLVPMLAPKGLVLVHDTGAIPRPLTSMALPPGVEMPAKIEWTPDDQVEVSPDERAFVNWALDAHPELSQVHLHSDRHVRWGLTLLQRAGPLPRSQ